MQKNIFISVIIFFLLFTNIILSQKIIIDHNCTNIKKIPESAITKAKNDLHIAYGHTSHGSQLITGMNNLDKFMGGTGLYLWSDGVEENKLDIDDYFVSGDLGNPDFETWESRTRKYLNNSNNLDVNVVIWSWCGEVSWASESNINTYLNLMNQLEIDYPNVKFVYMTGHSDGTGESGNLHIRNQQIRNYCITNNKVLYDFYDIECYDPDGNYFGDKFVNDNCDYDSNGDGSRDGNWAKEWQNSHTEGVDWYQCSSAHSQPLNANQKAYAAWWLWARLSGWNGITSVDSQNKKLGIKFELSQNYPNPFNPTTNIKFSIVKNSNVKLDIFNALGEHIKTLVDNYYSPGNYITIWNGKNDFGNKVNSGVYIYRLTTNYFVESKQMVLIK